MSDEAVSDSSFSCSPIVVTQHFVVRDVVTTWSSFYLLASMSFLVYYVYVLFKTRGIF